MRSLSLRTLALSERVSASLQSSWRKRAKACIENEGFATYFQSDLQIDDVDYNLGESMSKEKENFIVLSGDDGDIEVEVIDQTVVNGITYLLVADVVTDDEEEGDCYILKDVSSGDSEEADYEVVPSDEADGIFDAFEKMLKDEIDLKK